MIAESRRAHPAALIPPPSSLSSHSSVALNCARRMAALYALSAFFMTLAGGAFAWRFKKYLLFIMAFSAGLLLGVAFLDLLPEVFELAASSKIDVRILMTTLIAGFVAIFLLEKLTIIH